MPDYRRNRVAGGTYFFTVNLLDHDPPLLVEHIALLRESVRRVRELMPLHIDAWIVPIKMEFSKVATGRRCRQGREHTIRNDRD